MISSQKAKNLLDAELREIRKQLHRLEEEVCEMVSVHRVPTREAAKVHVGRLFKLS